MARRLLPGPTVLAAAVCLVTIALYWPGLSGGFLFDDWVNLPALGRYGPVRDWDGLLRYLASGIADPTGRPVSMLSFLIDARDWPAEAWPFKRTNVVLHACNGLALWSVLAALGRHVQVPASVARHAALLAAAIWMLHPLWVSTVLYVVQRHAMLATLFALLGARAWIASREAFAEGAMARGWSLAVLAVPVLGLVAGLSKANGFLLPLLLLALEATVLRPSGATGPAARQLRFARFALLIAPALALAAFIFWQATDPDAVRRAWSPAERLMSQPRALFDYLRHLLVPGLDATGVFADGFPASRGWLSPPTTLFAALGLVGLAMAAWMARARWPAFAAAVLFFLAGHAMESSVLPLELYFEHRNYLPAALIFWPAALWLVRPGRYLRWRAVAATGFLVLCAMGTLAQTKLWGNPPLLAQVWAAQLPQSARAQVHAASFDMARGDYASVWSRLEPLLRSDPAEAQYALTIMEARCAGSAVTPGSLDATLHALRANGVELDAAQQWLARTLHPGRRAMCADLPDDVLAGFVAGITETTGDSPEMQSRDQRLLALLALRRSDCPVALAAFNRRIDLVRRPEFVQEHVAALASYCGADAGLAHLNHYLSASERGDAPAATPMLRLRDRLIDRQGVWDDEWLRLRSVLEAELAQTDLDAPPRPTPD